VRDVESRVSETEFTSTRPGIDPILKALVDASPLQFRIEDGVEYAREQLRALKPPPEMLPAMRRIQDRTIGNADVTDVPVRIYWPRLDQHDNLPVVVFYHGGGWAIGDLDVYDGAARAHALGADAIVVSVGYRLAPEHPYPAGIDDSWAALRWVGEHAAELGADATRIAVAGDSAGGNISAVMTQLARDHGGPHLVFQLLWYPGTMIDLSLPSMVEHADAPMLSADMLAGYLRWYLPAGVDAGNPIALPPTLAPANAEDLSALPPAYIGIAEYDPLRDDGARYAELLSAAGVPVELNNAKTMVHGYMTLAAAVPAAAEATNRGLGALRAALHRT
jgi:acetyl esterase